MLYFYLSSSQALPDFSPLHLERGDLDFVVVGVRYIKKSRNKSGIHITSFKLQRIKPKLFRL